MNKKSPLNQGRTLQRNQRRQSMNALNRATRASLHSQKASAGSGANEIQVKIDAISKGKKSS